MSDIPFRQGSTRRGERQLGQPIVSLAVGWRAWATTSRVAKVLKVVIPIWLVSRLLYLILTYAAAVLTPGGANHREAFTPDRLLTLWQHWDANWYLSVAAGGYTNNPYRAAFFPLFPGLTAGVAAAIGGASHRPAAAMIVASLGTLAACIGLGLLAEHEFPSGSGKGPTAAGSAAAPPSSTSSAAVRVMLAYPLALFMFAGYADSLLVAFCVFAIYWARCRQWRWAAAAAFAAGLTRPTSIILVLPLFYEFGTAHGLWPLAMRSKWRELLGRLAPRLVFTWLLVTAAAPVAIGLYAAYLWHLFGDPLLFAHLQSTAWHRHMLAPWHLVQLAAATWQGAVPWSFDHAMMLVDELPVVVFAVLTLSIARRLPLTYTLLMLGVLFTSVATPMVHSPLPFAAAGRYLLPAVPVYLLLGYWLRQRPWLDQLIVGGGMALQAVLIVFFVNGGQLI
jgi:hypothetical protein